MTAVELLDTLRARGVELVAARDRLRFRPVEAVTQEEIEALRRFKGELLRVLAPRLPALLVKTVVEVLGPHPTTQEIRALGIEVATALARLRQEAETGHLHTIPLLIAGRPLADYLGLDELARILATWRPRPGGRRGAP